MKYTKRENYIWTVWNLQLLILMTIFLFKFIRLLKDKNKNYDYSICVREYYLLFFI